MSTQPHTENDLDRTEELPQLDVAAYEASMAEGALSSTDTWSVQALRDLSAEEQVEEPTSVSQFRAKHAPPGADQPAAADLMLDAERILTRVAQLEAELTSTRALNEQLEIRGAALNAEIAERRETADALDADNARLREQHSIGVDKLHGLERRLEAQAADLHGQLERAQALHAAAVAQAQATQLAAEQRAAQLQGTISALEAASGRLQEELRSATELLQTRARSIDDLQHRLEEQELNAAQMARFLGGKLVEHDSLAQALEQRDRRITHLLSDLERARTEFDSASEQRSANGEALSAERKAHEAARRALDERDGKIEQMRAAAEAAEARLQQLGTELQQQAGELAARDDEAEALQRTVAELRSANTSLQDALEFAQANVEELQTKLVGQAAQLESAVAELESAREQATQSAPAIQELEVALTARDELLADLRAELQTARDERAIMAGQLEKARVRNKTLAREVFQRDKRIATLNDDLAVHAETLAAIRQDISRLGAADVRHGADEPQRILEPVGHAGVAISLNRKVITVGRTSDNDACIPSKLVSRHHARLLVGPNAVIVEDAGSTNGCYVNDRLVKQQLMRDGDVLSLGDLKYRLRALAAQPARVRDNVVPILDPNDSV